MKSPSLFRRPPPSCTMCIPVEDGSLLPIADRQRFAHVAHQPTIPQTLLTASVFLNQDTNWFHGRDVWRATPEFLWLWRGPSAPPTDACCTLYPIAFRACSISVAVVVFAWNTSLSAMAPWL